MQIIEAQPHADNIWVVVELDDGQVFEGQILRTPNGYRWFARLYEDRATRANPGRILAEAPITRRPTP